MTPPFQVKLTLYVAAIIAASGVALAWVDWAEMVAMPSKAVWGLALLTVLGVLSEIFAVRRNGSGSPSTISLTFLPLISSCLIFGQAGAVLFIFLTEAVAELLIRRKAIMKALFNVSQAVLAAAAAGTAFTALGGTPIAALSGEIDYKSAMLPTATFGLVALVSNHAFVTVAVALSQPKEVQRILRSAFSRVGGTIVYDLLVLPVALLVAVLYQSLGLLGLVVAMLPLIFIRHAYGAKYRVESANRDLLQALVTAIETRDPYTSGHAKRVQDLAVRIGDHIRLSPTTLENLKAAALLHDIGKIEIRFEEVLKKPGMLSNEERHLIESHVGRGVDILRSLSSLSERVIEGVADHHERWDGKGYPKGIKGKDISLIGRVIAVSDSIDAMLSDRPYRDALSLPAVRAELKRCSGSQFDPQIAAVVESTDVLEEHHQGIRITRQLMDPKGHSFSLDSSQDG